MKEFGDGSGMSKDWRKTPNAMARVIKQKLGIYIYIYMYSFICYSH